MMIDAARIESLLSELSVPVGRPLTAVALTGSTNDDARRAAEEGAPHGACIIADAQTCGRGRHGRAWHSPAGENIYLSMLIFPRRAVADLPPLALAMGVAVARVVDALLLTPRAAIKWPNDVYVDARKIGGVLVETTTVGGAARVVVGVGLNVKTEHFPPDLAGTATSLRIAGADALQREPIAASLITRMGEAAARFDEAGLEPFIAELSARDFLRGRQVRVDDLEGVAAGIDTRGCLAVRDESGVMHTLSAGEVAWR